MNSNPYASTSSVAANLPMSPLLRNGWRHWLFRLALLALLSGVSGAAYEVIRWMSLSSILPAFVISAINTSLSALVLGLACRGFRFSSRAAFPATGTMYATCVLSLQLVLTINYSAIVNPLLFGRTDPTAQSVHFLAAFILKVPMMVLLFTFVARSWGSTPNWIAVGIATVATWGIWLAIEFSVFLPASQGLSVLSRLEIDLLIFLHRTAWCFCLGLFLPFVVQGCDRSAPDDPGA